jgi:hypothetical protein
VNQERRANESEIELTVDELSRATGGLTCRKAGESPIEFLDITTTSTTNGLRGKGGQFGP